MAKKKSKTRPVEASADQPAVNYVPPVEERVAKLEGTVIAQAGRIDRLVDALQKSKPVKGI